MAVVLPAPLGPMRANTAPSSNSMLSPTRASVPTNVLVRCSVRTTAPRATAPFEVIVPPGLPLARAFASAQQQKPARPPIPALASSPLPSAARLLCPTTAGAQRGWIPAAGQSRTNSGPHFEQPVESQLDDHFVRGVRINLQRLAEHSNRGECLPWRELAGDRGLFSGESNLLVNRNARFKCQAEWNHWSIMTRSTVNASLCPRSV